MILLAAKPAPNLRVHQKEFRVRQLHAQTLPRALRESHQVALELRVLDEALGAELQGIGKDVRVEMDEGRGHADGCLERSGQKVPMRETVGERGGYSPRVGYATASCHR